MPVNARRFIRKVRGGAQAHLLEADDGSHYIVKFQNNPQHRRILVNEVLGANILQYLEIASPVHQIINVSTEFLDANPDVHFQTGTKQAPVRPGLHSGSRHPGNPNTMPIYNSIPDALLGKVANLEQFLAVLAFDTWVANGDARQTIFLRAELGKWISRPGIPSNQLGFLALMIDHGLIFNGLHWDLAASGFSFLYPRRLVYQNVRSIGDFEPWLERIVNFPPGVLEESVRQIPSEWIGRDAAHLDRVLESLMRRRKRVPELLKQWRQCPGNPFPHWK